MDSKELYYATKLFNGHSLLFWALEWFHMSNDAFYKKYGFNFNPHNFPGLYEIARKRAFPKRE